LGKLANGQDCRVVIRTEHDAVTKNTTNDGIEYMTIKAFNEWDSRVCVVVVVECYFFDFVFNIVVVVVIVVRWC
jgi:hypothetical protein